MEDKPRYSRISDILDLAIYMSSKVQGVTLNEIAKRYCVSRKTALRMKDSLACIFPAVDEIPTDGIEKYWGFTNYSMSKKTRLQAQLGFIAPVTMRNYKLGV